MGLFDSLSSFIAPVAQALVSAVFDSGNGAADTSAPGMFSDNAVSGAEPTGGELGMSMGENPGGSSPWYSNVFSPGAADTLKTAGNAGLDLTGSVTRAALPTLLAGGATALINKMFGSPAKPLPYKDVRNPDQMANYQQLAQDYRQGQSQMPLWNSIQEDEIRRNTLGEASRAGVADSGQAMKMVNRNLTDYRMNVAQQHEQNQIARAGMLTGAAGPSVQSQGVIPAYNPAQLQTVPIGVSVPKAMANDTVGRDSNYGQPVSTNPYGGGRGQQQPSYRNPYA